MVNGKTHLLLDEPDGSTAKVLVFSDSVFCTGSLDPTSASEIGETKGYEQWQLQNRNDIAGQTI